jgi:hypothetical protein
MFIAVGNARDFIKRSASLIRVRIRFGESRREDALDSSRELFESSGLG